MPDQTEKNLAEEKQYRRFYRLSAVISIAASVFLLFMVFAYAGWFNQKIGPRQPIPFSHRVHATEKGISCVFCHSGAIDTDVAGVPPLETCILCHSKIIIHYPQIAQLREHFDKKIPVEWVRVNVLQEFVFFSHQLHIQSGVDCGKCHGDVAKMDRIVMKKPFNMGFCVQCHRDTEVSHDCLICHR